MRIKSSVPRNAEEYWGGAGDWGDVSPGAARTDGTGMQTAAWWTRLDVPGSYALLGRTKNWLTSGRVRGCHFPAGRPEGRPWALLLKGDSHEPGVSWNTNDTRAGSQRCWWAPIWRQDFFSPRVWNKASGSFEKKGDFVFQMFTLPLEFLMNIQRCEMGYMLVWPSWRTVVGYLEREIGPS